MMGSLSIVFCIFFGFKAYSGFLEVDSSNLYAYKKEVKPSPVKRKASKKNQADSFNKIMEGDKLIFDLLSRQEKNINLRQSTSKITSLSRFHGLTLNSILAMNVRPTTFIVKAKVQSSDIDGAEFRCTGYSFEKRVPSKCDLMVLDDHEYEVDVSIWDRDGAEGVIADYYYTGEEKTFLTSTFASFLGATLSVAKGGINTPIGNVSNNNSKNKILEGLVGVTDNAREKVIESGESLLSISYVNSGKSVLLFFNSSLNLSKEVK